MAFAFVQSDLTIQASATTSIVTGTFTSTPTTGNLLIAFFVGDKDAGTITTPTDWTAIATVKSDTSVTTWMGYKFSTGNESSVAVDYSTNRASKLLLVEYSGTDITYDTYISNNSGASSVSALSTGTTSTLTGSTSLVFAGWGQDSTNASETAAYSGSTTVTARVEDFTSSGTAGQPAFATAENLAVSTSTAQATCTFTIQSDQTACIMGVFYEAASGPAITDVDTDEIVSQGQTSVAITGTDFTTDTGSADIVLCKVDNVTGTNATSQTETGTRTSTAAYFTANFPSDVAEGETCYVFVVDSAGDSNASGFLITREDITAPTLTTPASSNLGETTATGSVSTNEADGTMYAIVSVSGTAPSVAQIQAGNDNAGNPATWDGSQAISSTGSKSFNATGLTADTNYYFHFQHTDSSSNDSTVSTTAQFTTTSVPVFTITVTGITGGESLTGLEWMVLSGQDLSSASIECQGSGETTDANGDLVITVTSVIDTQSVWYIIKNTADTIAAQGPATVVES